MVKVNQPHYRPEVPRGFQEIKVPRLRDNGPTGKMVSIVNERRLKYIGRFDPFSKPRRITVSRGIALVFLGPRH